MCNAKRDGGARCDEIAHLKALTDEDLTPAPIPGVEEVDWGEGPRLAQVWADFPQPTAALAIALVREAERVEPEITTDVRGAAHASGTTLYGEQWRLKAPYSLARKIQDKLYQRIEESTCLSEQVDSLRGAIKDAVRYTALVPEHDEMVAFAQRTTVELQERGWTLLEVEEKYDEGVPYKGLHTLWESRGQKVEVQFHSRESQAVKDLSHPLYSIARDKVNHDLEERALADEKCVELWSAIPTPRGLSSLRVLGGVTVEHP